MGLAESRECSGVRVKCLEWDELGGKGACLESTQPELTTTSSTTVVMTDEEVAMPQSFIASLALFYQQDLKPSLRLRLATFYILNDAFLDGFDLDDSAIPLLALLQSNGSIASLRWFISSYQQKCGSDEGEGAHLVNTPFDVDVHLSDSTVRVSATPLAFAVALSRGPAVEYFLGPAFVGILDINTKGEDGSTALSIAAILENDAALSLLLSDARTTLETMEAALKSLNGFILHGPSGVSAQQVFSPSRSNGGSTDAIAPLSPVSLGNLSASSVLLSAAIAAKAGGSSTSARVSSLDQASGSSSSLALLALAPPHHGGSGKASKQTSVKASVVKFAPSAGGAGGGGGGGRGSEKSSNSNSDSSSSKITRHGEEQQQLDLPLPSRLSLGSFVAERPPGFCGGPTPPPPALAATSLVSSDHTPMLLAPASFAGASSGGGGGGVGGTGSADGISSDTPGVSLLFSELPLFTTAYSQPTDVSPTPRASTSVPASGSGSGSGSSSDADSAAPWIEVQRDNSTTSDDSAFSGSVCGSEVSSSLSTATTATHYTLGGGGGKSSRDAPHSFSSSWYKRMATPAKRVKKSLFRG